MDYDELVKPLWLRHPWFNSNGELAHPDSPAGDGGPGRFKSCRSLGRTLVDPLFPHGQSAAARYFALTAAQTDGAANSSGAAPPATTKKLTCSGVFAAGGPLNDATIDAVNEAVKKQSNKRYIAYDVLVKVGGSISWRANNPGNLRDASTKIASAPGAVGNFAVFATMEDGRAAQKALYLNKYGNLKVRDAVSKLTPPEENDTNAYLEQLKAAGIDLDKTVASQIDSLMIAIRANEGLIEGVDVSRKAS